MAQDLSAEHAELARFLGILHIAGKLSVTPKQKVASSQSCNPHSWIWTWTSFRFSLGVEPADMTKYRAFKVMSRFRMAAKPGSPASSSSLGSLGF